MLIYYVFLLIWKYNEVLLGIPSILSDDYPTKPTTRQYRKI